MVKLNNLFEDGELINYLKNNHDSWIGTPYEGYSNLSATQMGRFGEKIVSKYMKNNGHDVQPRINAGHDRVIDGFKTEIKFSLSLISDKFILNHLSCEKDWDRLIFLGVSPNDYNRMIWFEKNKFNDYMTNNTKPIFRRQQGGEQGTNDDYMFSGNITKLMNLQFVYLITDWNNSNANNDAVQLTIGLTKWFN